MVTVTERREWPNSAKWARDRAAEMAIEGVRALSILVTQERPVNETERILRVARALRALQEIERLLEGQGAPVREEL